MVLVATVCALVAPAAPAHADAEMERLDCTGDIGSSGTLHDPSYQGTGTISCTKTHYGVVAAWPDGGFTATVDVQMWNSPEAPGVYQSYGNLSFTADGERWTVAITHHESVLGVLPLGVTDPLSSYDDAVWSASSPYAYNIRYGEMNEDLYACARQSCWMVKPSGFSFVAEYVYDLPVAVGVEAGHHL